MKTSKLIAGLSAVAMLASGSTFVASAADTVGVAAGKTTATAGETFSVDISLSDVPSTGISCIEFGVEFDKSVITITDVALGAIAQTGAADAEGAVDSSLSDTVFDWNVVDNELDIVWVTGLTDSNYWITDSGVFVTITGTVNANAADGAVSDLKIVPISRDSYPESGSANADSIVGYLDANGAAVSYGTALTAGSVTVGSAVVGGDTLYGDVNCDGKIDIVDLVLLARYVSQDPDLTAGTITDQGKTNAEVDLDGQIGSGDITGLALYLAGNGSLPVK